MRLAIVLRFRAHLTSASASRNAGFRAHFFFDGDGAYSAGVHMVCPFNKTAHTDFDWVQSSNRMAIECAFGILIRR